MAWTYSGNPASSLRDRVRFLIGDTDSTNQLLQDAEIDWLLSQWNNDAYVAATQACNSLATRFAAKSDYSKSVGDLSISTQYGQQADRYRALAAALAAQAATASPPSPVFYQNEDGHVGHYRKFYIDMEEYE